MSIFFIILTVIGILFLVILTLAALCLFYPVSYRIRGEAEEEMSLAGRFWWLFGILWFEVAVKGFEPEIRFGILWFQKSLWGKETAGQESGCDTLPKTPALEQKPDMGAAPAPRPKKEAEEEPAPKRDKKGKRPRPKSRAKQRKGFNGKSGRVRSLKESYARFKGEISDEKNRMAVRHIWREITYIVTRLKPKYIDGGLDFSTGDPALTGLLTGALSMLPVLYQYGACVYPDFTSDTPYLKGALSLGGRMSLYHGLLCLIRLIRNKNTMQFIQKFR